MVDSKLYHERRNQPETTPEQQLEEVTQRFITNLGRIADFFGFNALMGRLYGVLFLSPKPLSLEDMVDKLESSKGNVSINIRALEHWGLVHRVYKWGKDRRDYYEAESDIWKAIGNILQERERKESLQMIESLNQSVSMLEKFSQQAEGDKAEMAAFYLHRMETLRRLFQFSDQLLESMVRGGQVNFGTASHLGETEVDLEELEDFSESEIEVETKVPGDAKKTEEGRLN
jgi:DNA-binding transcriptional regulator GbsR (MarR family)